MKPKGNPVRITGSSNYPVYEYELELLAEDEVIFHRMITTIRANMKLILPEVEEIEWGLMFVDTPITNFRAYWEGKEFTVHLNVFSIQ